MIEEYGGAAGLIEGFGNTGQVVNQVIGVATVFVYGAVVSLVILKVIDWTIGLKVPKDVEIEGLDITLHGEVVQ
jgi:ammonium transporter, Amt family